jgi:hypothetical protein
MILTGAASSVYAKAFSRSRQRVELLNAGSGLDNRFPRESCLAMVNRQEHELRGACHSETRTHPGLVENRLSSTFVAQVLGQQPQTQRADGFTAGRVYAQAAHQPPAPRLLRLV